MIPTHTTSKFRTDINALRAWAVIAVLFFHFQIPGFDAGFMGVDIFFVISGFLMTSIIVGGFQKGSFSVWQFYMARFRRIVPALMVLISVLLILGWFWLPTPDYQSLGTQSAYALSFLSNIHYWRASGYFDSGAFEKWLLHTWSLGVEMQFYILFPVFVAILWKLKPSIKFIFYSLLVIFTLSFALNVVASSLKPVPAFYLLPTRGWELAFGGLVYFTVQFMQQATLAKHGKTFYLFGLAFWIVGFLLIDNTLAWPSGWALLPVLGTGLIILASQQDTRLMSNPLAQWLGNISYSLYLWHWPLVVALHFAGLQHDWLWIIGAFALSLVLADLSYRFVEIPTRQGLVKLSLVKQVASFALVAVLIGASAVSVRLFVFDNRLPEAVEIAAAEVNNKDPRRAECFEKAAAGKNTGCTYGEDRVDAVLMGDSHSGSAITAFGQAAQNFNKGVVFYGRSSCLTIDGVIASNKTGEEAVACKNLNEWAFEQIKKLPKDIPVVSVSRTSTYLVGPNEPDRQDEVEEISVHFGKPYKYRNDPIYIKEFQQALITTACRIAQERPFYLMRPVPEYGTSIPNDITRNIVFRNDGRDIKISLIEYHKRNKLVWQAQDEAAEKCGVKILNPLPYLCDDQYCYGSKNGRPLYYDDDHLSEYGNQFLVPMFEEVFKNELPAATQ